MKGISFYICIGLCSLLQGYSFSASYPLPERYVGILRHTGIKREQLAKLDFVYSREEGNTVTLKAILTLHFGDFKSGEYISYHFGDVKYSIPSGAFIFGQSSEPVKLIGKLKSVSEFTGEFRSVYTGETGTLILNSDTPVKPDLPLLEPVWGEFKGRCQSKNVNGMVDTVLQLYTYRSTESAAQAGNPFHAYKIKGFLGEKPEKGCIGGNADYCVWGVIQNGLYNFYQNRLFLYNNYRNLSCIPEADGLRCNECEFLKRVSREIVEPRILKPPSYPSKFKVEENIHKLNIGKRAALDGSYYGYVHHQYLDTYQAAQVNILTYQEGTIENPILRIAASGALYFGTFDTVETLPYLFAERSYPNPSSLTQFVFDNSDVNSGVDAILQVTTIGDGVLKGVWYSKLFGKVGAFEMYRDKPLSPPIGAKEMTQVSGRYESKEWAVDILASLDTSQSNTKNPFAPLTFAGWLMLKGVTAKSPLTGGSYDFYTGKIGFEAGDIVHLGERPTREKLLLKRMNYGIMAPLLSFPLQPYELVEK